MRLSCFFVVGALGSMEFFDAEFLEDLFSSTGDQALEDFVTDEPVPLPLGGTVEVLSPPLSLAGFRWKLPQSCRRDISIVAAPEYTSALQAILASGIVPSLNTMFRLGGTMGRRDVRYKALHGAVRLFRRGVEVSAVLLRGSTGIRPPRFCGRSTDLSFGMSTPTGVRDATSWYGSDLS
jgi:hypothetical protein